VDDSRTLPDITVNFVKSHSLMDAAVPALFSRPVFTRISLQSRLTSIAVDNQVSGLKGQYYDVLFLGTGKAPSSSCHRFDTRRVIQTTHSVCSQTTGGW